LPRKKDGKIIWNEIVNANWIRERRSAVKSIGQPYVRARLDRAKSIALTISMEQPLTVFEALTSSEAD
jgi:hypothetical protein